MNTDNDTEVTLGAHPLFNWAIEVILDITPTPEVLAARIARDTTFPNNTPRSKSAHSTQS